MGILVLAEDRAGGLGARFHDPGRAADPAEFLEGRPASGASLAASRRPRTDRGRQTSAELRELNDGDLGDGFSISSSLVMRGHIAQGSRRVRRPGAEPGPPSGSRNGLWWCPRLDQCLLADGSR